MVSLVSMISHRPDADETFIMKEVAEINWLPLSWWLCIIALLSSGCLPTIPQDRRSVTLFFRSRRRKAVLDHI